MPGDRRDSRATVSWQMMTTRGENGDRRRARRPQRIGFAVAALVLHVLVLYLLLNAKQAFHVSPEDLDNRNITWIVLPTPAKVQQPPANTSGPRVRAKAKSHAPAQPPSEPQTAPPTATPEQDRASAAL